MLNSFVKMLNLKLSKKNYQTISVGIGIDDGRTLMIQAGYKGSSINEVVWMGNAVNNACHLANKAGRDFREPIVVSSVIYKNLKTHNQSLLSSYYDSEYGCYNYEGNVISTRMEEWINNN